MILSTGNQFRTIQSPGIMQHSISILKRALAPINVLLITENRFPTRLTERKITHTESRIFL